MRTGRWTVGLVVGALIAGACSQLTPEELSEKYSTGDLDNLIPDDDDASGDDTGDPGGDDGDSGGDGDTGGGPIAPVVPDPDPTPLESDPDVLIGQLDNGLVYYLRTNDSPGSALDLRLAVNAGSMQQAVPDSGGAHFLEHMLFNGTEQFPGNELDRALQRLGIEFGPELNAFTSYDETVYILRASTTDDVAVTTALDVLAEWASAAIIDPDEVIAERGVVRDELRQRKESVDGIIFDEFERIYTAGTPYEGFGVIGDPEKIETTEAPPLRAYYDRWYRPDNMAVIIVGDLPVRELERMVEARFADLGARGNDHPERTDIVVEVSPDPFADIVTHPENVVDNLSVDIPVNGWDTGTAGGAELLVWETLIADMVSTRLTDAWFAGELELDQEPWFGEFSINRGLRYFGSNLQGPDLAAALEQYLGVLRGAAEGFTQSELDAAVENYSAGLDAWEDSLGTTQDWEYAQAYTSAFLSAAPPEAPRDTIARERHLLTRVTTGLLASHWAWMLEVGGPIIVAVGADESTLPTVDQMLDIALSAAATGPTESGPEITSLMDPPAPVDPVDTTRANNPEWYTWEFANGAAVVFRPTTISENGFVVYAEGLGGYSIMAEGAAALTGLAVDAVSQSGIGEIGPGELDRFLADKSVSLSPFIDLVSEGFTGSATTEDAEILFQLLHLLVTEPRVDDVAFNSATANGENLQQLAESDPATAAAEELGNLIYGDGRFSFVPTDAQLDAATPADLLEVYESRLGGVDDLIVSIAGDLHPDDVEWFATRYIGTLPDRPVDTFADVRPDGPDAVGRREVGLAAGTANGGIEMLWTTEREWTDETAMTAAVLERIISSRILDTVREELGASYGGWASITPMVAPDSRLDALVTVDGDPSRIDEIRTTVLRELEELATDGPTDDEFERARSVLGNDYDFFDNWTLMIEALEVQRDANTEIVTTWARHGLLRDTTTNDVRTLAAELFGPGLYLEVTRTNG